MPGRSNRMTVVLAVCLQLNFTPSASQYRLMRGMPVPYCSIIPEWKSVCAMPGLRCLRPPSAPASGFLERRPRGRAPGSPLDEVHADVDLDCGVRGVVAMGQRVGDGLAYAPLGISEISRRCIPGSPNTNLRLMLDTAKNSALLSGWISGRPSCWRFGLGRAEARCEVRVGDGLAWQCLLTCLSSRLVGGLYQSVMDSSIW